MGRRLLHVAVVALAASAIARADTGAGDLAPETRALVDAWLAAQNKGDFAAYDKLYAKNIKPVHRHWSGKHRKVVWGVNLISLVWSDGDRVMPIDYRVYDAPNDGLTKNDHFSAMIAGADRRGFRPRAVLFDSWYASLTNLKQVRGLGRIFLTQLKSNRRVDADRGAPRDAGPRDHVPCL